MEKFSYRYATEQDAALILEFIRGLAEYEKMSDLVVATPELLRYWIFKKQKAEVIFALENGKEVGFALFFHNFQPSWAERDSILRICSFCPNTAAKATAPKCLRLWHALRLSEVAEDLSGPVLTGINPA